MHLFIDTNIFLSFYHLTNDDLEELKKLEILINSGEVTLLIPDQVIDEFTRNRENKISDAIKRLKDQKLNLQFPQLCKDYPEYATLKKLQSKYHKRHSKLIEAISQDVSDESLKADTTIAALWGIGTTLKTTVDIMQSARDRVDLGNPPGKNGSMGDAVNWEALLSNVAQENDLFLISDDRDFYSSLHNNSPKAFLEKEWERRKHSNVKFYRRLSQFFREHFPDISIASEAAKEKLITDLENSGSFSTTHDVIGELSKIDDYSDDQVIRIAESGITNTQIYWLFGDGDVYSFYKWLIKKYGVRIPKDLGQILMERLDD